MYRYRLVVLRAHDGRIQQSSKPDDSPRSTSSVESSQGPILNLVPYSTRDRTRPKRRPGLHRGGRRIRGMEDYVPEEHLGNKGDKVRDENMDVSKPIFELELRKNAMRRSYDAEPQSHREWH
jgi:hypothetical protein